MVKILSFFKIIFFSFFLSLGIISCKDFIESPVTEKKVFLNAPADSLETNKYQVQFWWDVVEDATAYRLQVVNPDFKNVAILVLDTIIKRNKFNYTLDPGKYQWQVRAENGSSQGLYTSRSFTIYPSTLDKQQVQVNSPLNGFVTNKADIIFNWLPLFGAKNYVLQLDTNNFSNQNKLVLNQTTPAFQYSFSLPKSKTYQWRVRAKNDSDSTQWSPVQSFSFDNTTLDKVILITPIDKQMLPNPVKLKWEAVNGAVKYELRVFKSDQVTPYSSTFPLTLTSTNYTFTSEGFNQNLYWKVRAINQAGNIGLYSNLQSFTVQ